MYPILLITIFIALQMTAGCVGGGGAVALAVIGAGGSADGGLTETRYVASEVHGRVLDNGEPVPNETIIRRIHVLEWGDSIEQKAQTNHFGYFRWDRLTSRDLRKGIAKMNFQHEYILLKGEQPELFWAGTKYGNENLSEIFSAGNSVMLSGREFFKIDGERLYFEIDLAELKKR